MIHAQKRMRKDIQGLRAVAIVGVLLFHLAPKRFTNGFLGVDIFFVLSGYLMSSILAREPAIDLRVVKTFYIRRFKRIAPLYAMMLGVLAIITPLIFVPSDMNHFISDMEWALPFAENMQNVLKNIDYWAQVFNSPVLLHAWSLGVEVQYYLVVPFIMIVARFGQTRRFRIISFVGICGVSYAIHFFSYTTVSFGLLFARVWQFLTGSIFYELEGVVEDSRFLKEEGDDFDIVTGTILKSRPSKWSISISVLTTIMSYGFAVYLLWMVIMSSNGPTISRLFVTFATGVLLLIGKYRENKIISNVIMSYIGDLSYLIYLAHWPVIVLFKYYNDVSDLTVPDMYACLIATLLISVLLHHSLEIYFITASTTVSVAFVGVIYSIIVLALLFRFLPIISTFAHPVVQDEIEAIRWNQEQYGVVYFKNPEGCVRDFEAERWTGFTEEEELRCVSTGTGTAKVLVMGNSYGYRVFPVLHRLFAGRYSQMRMFTKSARTYLTKDLNSTVFADAQRVVIEKFQPDITFFVEKDSYETLMKPIVGTVEDDPITKHVQGAVDFLSNNSGTVVVDQQYVKPQFNSGIAYIIQKRLQQGRKHFEDLEILRKKYEAEFANEIGRMATIKNKNVIVNRVQDQLCPGQFCFFFNRDNLHALYGDTSAHLTSEGLRLLEPNYSKIINDFLSRRLRWSKQDS